MTACHFCQWDPGPQLCSGLRPRQLTCQLSRLPVPALALGQTREASCAAVRKHMDTCPHVTPAPGGPAQEQPSGADALKYCTLLKASPEVSLGPGLPGPPDPAGALSRLPSHGGGSLHGSGPGHPPPAHRAGPATRVPCVCSGRVGAVRVRGLQERVRRPLALRSHGARAQQNLLRPAATVTETLCGGAVAPRLEPSASTEAPS